ALAITNTISGKNGRKASINGKRMPGKGPRLSYSFNKCWRYSSNLSCSSQILQSIMLTFNKYMYLCPLNLKRLFRLFSSITVFVLIYPSFVDSAAITENFTLVRLLTRLYIPLSLHFTLYKIF